MRVVIQQPALPHYRVPVFRALAQVEGLVLSVVYGGGGDQPPSVLGDSVRSVRVPSYSLHLPGRVVTWDTGQWRYATPHFSDVIVLSWNLNSLSLVPALLRARMGGIGTVLWGHGYSKRESPWRRYLRNAVTALADAVAVYGNAAAQDLKRSGLPRQKLFVALNALDQTPIQHARKEWLSTPDRLEAFRRKHGLEGRFVVLFISRLRAENRLDWLVEALHLLRSSEPEVVAVVIGDGSEERERIDSLARASDVSDRMTFLPEEYDEDKLAPWFMSASVLCYPRNVGLSLLHAFGYSLPVVTSNAIENQGPEIEALVPGENGLLFEDGDSDSLAEALKALSADPTRLVRMGMRAHETVTENYTLEKLTSGLLSAIEGSAARAAVRRGGDRH